MSRKKKDPKDLSIFRRHRLGLLTPKEVIEYRLYMKQWSLKQYGTPKARAMILFRSAKKAAKNKNLEFDLTHQWIWDKIERGVCERSGLSFVLSSMNTGKYGAGSQHPFGPSLDKSDRTKGYTQDNVKVVVWLYNIAKHTNSHDDLMKLARALVERESGHDS